MLSRTKKAARPPSVPKNGEGFSFIAEDVVINGDIATGANIQLNGRIVGDVRCALLHQGEKGVITGNMEAEEAHLAGLVDGTVTTGALVLQSTARVTGDVVYETLSIAAGARIDGRFTCRKPAGNADAPRLIVAPTPAPQANGAGVASLTG